MAMDVERLIEFVKQNVFLYDLGHKDYKNTSRKAAAWESIAEELNENSETVRLKWKTVRDGYIKFRKQQKEGTNKKGINYIWSSQLKFLDDYQVSRRGKKAAMAQAASLQLSEDDSETHSQSYSPATVLIPSPSDSGPFRTEPALKRKREQIKNLNFLNDKRVRSVHYDATDHLFLSYSETFKMFTPRQQALLKVELAKLFSNAELNELQSAEDLQEALVVGSTHGYNPLIKREREDRSLMCMHVPQSGQDDDEDSDDDEDIEYVDQVHVKRERTQSPSDTTG